MPKPTLHCETAAARAAASPATALAGSSSLKIIGNLPFNLAGAILERLCGYRETVSRMILMFQREVAERIRARAGARSYAALSVYTALYWQVGEHFRVAAGSFHPK